MKYPAPRKQTGRLLSQNAIAKMFAKSNPLRAERRAGRETHRQQKRRRMAALREAS